jgi:hypothetical protein
MSRFVTQREHGRSRRCAPWAINLLRTVPLPTPRRSEGGTSTTRLTSGVSISFTTRKPPCLASLRASRLLLPRGFASRCARGSSCRCPTTSGSFTPSEQSSKLPESLCGAVRGQKIESGSRKRTPSITAEQKPGYHSAFPGSVKMAQPFYASSAEDEVRHAASILRRRLRSGPGGCRTGSD